MRGIKKIIVHCSDSDFGTANIIDKWHKERGWKGIGYHYVITNGRLFSGSEYTIAADGILEKGRPEEEIGAHCKEHNADSIGICLIGKKDFTEKQLFILKELLQDLLKKYNLTKNDVYGHYEFNSNKTCPNLNMDIIRESL